MTKVGIVIQGNITHDNNTVAPMALNLGRRFGPTNVVVSHWANDHPIQLPVKEIIHKVPQVPSHFQFINQSNRFFQAHTTYYGIYELLKYDDYDVIIKIRTDEYFESLDPLVDQVLEQPNKIHAGHFLFRRLFPFHIGDHVVAGSAENMRLLYQAFYSLLTRLVDIDCFLEECRNRQKYHRAIFNNRASDKLCQWNPTTIPAETLLTLCYLWGTEGNNVVVSRHVELMRKYFEVFDLRKTGDLFLRCNTHNTNFNRSALDNIHYVLKGFVDRACTKCHPKIMCATRKLAYQKYVILGDHITSMSDLIELDDDIKIYNALYKTWLVHDHDMVEIC